MFLRLLFLFTCLVSCEDSIVIEKKTPSVTLIPELNCPTGFIAIKGNSDYDGDDFCVMQFEARGTPGNIVSDATTPVYVNVNATVAFNECAAMNEVGFNGTFRLISTNEWMTILRDIETVPANWSSGTIGTGSIPRGHSDNSTPNPMTISDLNDPYSDTGNSAAQAVGAGWEQRRTLHTTNAKVIWDFAGNAWEWSDWSNLDVGMTQGATGNIHAGWEEPTNLTPGLMAHEIQSANGYGSAQGFGQFYDSVNGGPIRGGAHNRGAISGVSAINLDASLGTGYATTGFRCVYIP